MKMTQLALTAICAISATVVMADKKATDTSPAEDLKVYRDYFNKRFPGIPLNEFGNGVYAIDKVSRDSWEAIEEFPPYEQVIPKSNDKTAVVSRGALLDALKRVTVVSEEKTLGVRFDLSEGVLEIETNNPSVGQGSEQLDISYDGDNVTIGFNARYFIDILNVLRDDEIKMELSGSLDPVVIRDPNDLFIGVVMPMRI